MQARQGFVSRRPLRTRTLGNDEGPPRKCRPAVRATAWQMPRQRVYAGPVPPSARREAGVHGGRGVGARPRRRVPLNGGPGGLRTKLAAAMGGFTSSPHPGGGRNRTISYIGDQKPCIPCTTTVRFRNADLVVSSFEKRDSEYDVVPLLLTFVLLHL
jgi:hypothetical protein